MNIEELMTYIEKRPQMYFREKNVYYLEAFLGLVMNIVKIRKLKNDFRSSFYKWLQNKFILENKSTWADFIDIISKKENLNSLDVFFTEYHLFKKENK